MAEDPDTTKMASSAVDDAYHEYLWGEASPRSFARKARLQGTNRRESRNVIHVNADPSLDASRFVPR